MKLFRMWASELLSGYGWKPSNILIASVIIIVISGTVYWQDDGLARNDVLEINDRIDNSTHEDEIVFNYQLESNETEIRVYEYYYFSVVTFTTLGFGDVSPSPDNTLSQIWSSMEAIIGVIAIAVYAIAGSKKYFK